MRGSQCRTQPNKTEGRAKPTKGVLARTRISADFHVGRDLRSIATTPRGCSLRVPCSARPIAALAAKPASIFFMHFSSAALAEASCVGNSCSDIGNGSCGMGASAFLIPAIVGKRSVVTVSTTPKREPFLRRGHLGIGVHLEQRWTLGGRCQKRSAVFPHDWPSPLRLPARLARKTNKG